MVFPNFIRYFKLALVHTKLSQVSTLEVNNKKLCGKLSTKLEKFLFF